MATNDCIAAIKAAVGPEKPLSDDQLEAVVERVQGKVRRLQREGLSLAEAATRAGREAGDEIRLAAQLERRTLLINRAVDAGLEDFLPFSSGKYGVKDIRRLITGTEGKGRNYGNSVDAEVRGAAGPVLGDWTVALEKAGLDKVLRRGDKAFDRDVMREMRAKSEGSGRATSNALAQQAADINHAMLERVRSMQNSAGAWIGAREDYIVRQVHDMMRIRKAGFQEWRDFILPRLGEETFDGLDRITPEAVDEYLQSVFNALSTGIHDTSRGVDYIGGMGGTANLARRVSSQRKLHFKDADAFADYHEAFGKGSLHSTMRASLENGARNAALMRRLGTNPEAKFKQIIKRASDYAGKTGDTDLADSLNSDWNERLFDVVSGRSQLPGRSSFAQIANGFSAFQTLSKLGQVMITSFADMANVAATLRHSGVPIFESYSNAIKALMPGGGADREVAAMLGAGIDGILGNIASRHSGVEYLPGRIAKSVDLFHRMNGLEYWTEHMKAGTTHLLSHNLGRLADREFGALPPRLQTTLTRYGIESGEWNSIRQAAGTAADKRVHLLPGEVADAALGQRLQTYYADQISEAMNEPDAWARTLASGGTKAGTGIGTAVRLLMQFKTYPVTFITRTLNREFRRDGVDIPGIVHLGVMTTVLGYVSMELKNMLRGRNSRTSDARTREDYEKLVAAAFVQGGGAGLFGDFLFGEQSRTGSGPVVNLLGPTFENADNAVKFAHNVVNAGLYAGTGTGSQAAKDAGTGGIALAQSNLPFGNLPIVRTVLEHFVWHALSESVNPGYLQRYERNVRDQQHQSFWLSPSGRISMPH